jgi:hypothetical protein
MESFCLDVDKWLFLHTRKNVPNDLYNAFVVLKVICYFHRNNVMFGVGVNNEVSVSRRTSLSPYYKYSPTKNLSKKPSWSSSRSRMRRNAKKTRTTSFKPSSRKTKSVNDTLQRLTNTNTTQDAETVYKNMLRANGVPLSFYTPKHVNDIYPLSYPIFCQVFYTFVEVIDYFYSNVVKTLGTRGYSYELLCKTVRNISTSPSSNKPYKTGLLDFISYYKTYYSPLYASGFNSADIETLKRYNLHKVFMYNKDIETDLASYTTPSLSMLQKCVKNGIAIADAKSQYRDFMVDYRTKELPMIDYLRFFINLGNTEDVGTILLHITEGELVEPAELLYKLLTSSCVQVRPEMAHHVLIDFRRAHQVFMSQEYDDMMGNSCKSGKRFKYACPNGKKYTMLCNASMDEVDDVTNKQIITAYCDME